MMGALFKKQMMEVFSWVYQNKKSGKNRTAKGIAGYVLLYLLIFGILGAVFYFVANTLCRPLASAGMGWLYFAIMGLMALFLGVFGSVFNTYASLYKSKDNDFLLAMPIPPVRILSIRLSGVYFTGLMYELIVMIPTLIVWFLNMELGAVGVVCTLLIPLVLSVLALVFSALLGWLVALVSNKLKHKNVVVVLLSLVVFAVYYYFCGHIYSIAQTILANPQEVGDQVRSILYPLYHMGLAAEGNLLSMLIFAAIAGGLFALTFWVLSRNFLKIVTSNRGEAKARYQEKRLEARSVSGALLHKELLRFLGSASYMLNCGLGVVIMLVSAVVFVWKRAMLQELIQGVFAEHMDTVFLAAAAAVCYHERHQRTLCLHGRKKSVADAGIPGIRQTSADGQAPIASGSHPDSGYSPGHGCGMGGETYHTVCGPDSSGNGSVYHYDGRVWTFPGCEKTEPLLDQ